MAKGMFLGVLALSAGPPAGPPALNAQEPVRAHLMGDPLPGRDAPAFSLPYVTAAGRGPADQPFKLRAELGRVVVLAFVPGLPDSSTTMLVRTFTARADTLFPGEVVVGVAAPMGVDRLTAAAAGLGNRLKFLADSLESVRRLYGVDRRSLAVYVISPLGKISWRELNANPFARATYDRIQGEVAKAGKAGPKG